MLWANLHLLFWLSLVPFVTGWMGENHFAAVPTAVYGVVLLMAAIAYFILQQAIIALAGAGFAAGRRASAATGRASSRRAHLRAIAIGRPSSRLIAVALYVLVALIWLVPDRRIERQLAH